MEFQQQPDDEFVEFVDEPGPARPTTAYGTVHMVLHDDDRHLTFRHAVITYVPEGYQTGAELRIEREERLIALFPLGAVKYFFVDEG